MAERVRWGILSTGSIAHTFAEALAESRTGRLGAVASRTRQKADAFAAEFDVPAAHPNYEALLADDAVEAVYLAMPHPWHAEWARRAAEAGKAVLCEKPLTMNAAEAETVVEAARTGDVFLMEAFMYRCHPQTSRLAELLREKAVGDVRVIHAAFSFCGDFGPEERHVAKDLGGGGILDVGCYCTSMARLVAGAALGGEHAEPEAVCGAAAFGETGVDEWAVASLRFPGDILAQLACGIRVGQPSEVRIYGSEGSITVPDPWFPSRGGEPARMVLARREAEPEEIVTEADRGLYAIEADVAGEAIRSGKRRPPYPAMRWDDTLGNMRTLDAWREAVGLVYDADRT